MPDDLHSWIVLAHLIRPQGRKGELLAELLTDFPERFQKHPRVFLAEPNFNGTEKEARSVAIESSWLPLGKNKGRVVLQFAGIETISAAESIAGLDVIIPARERLPLEDDSVYVSDLVGCIVYDHSVMIGPVEDVQFPMSPDGATRLEEAAPLLAVRSAQGDEFLIPFAKSFLTKIDLGGRRIDMELPQGLLEINTSTRTKTE